MAFTQLNPHLPIMSLAKGRGQAIAVIDYSPEYNLIWVIAIDETGEIWACENPDVRLLPNWTLNAKREQK